MRTGWRDTVSRIVSQSFVECHGGAYGLISVCPEIYDLAAQQDFTHRNIRIVGNRISTAEVTLLYAKSVKGIEWRGNRVEYNDNLPPWNRPKYVLEHCEDQRIE